MGQFCDVPLIFNEISTQVKLPDLLLE